MYMALTKKTIILFPPELHTRLSHVAAERQTSLGDLVRRACEKEYGEPSSESKRAALQHLTSLRLPVSDPKQMERESVPAPRKLVP